MEDCLVDGLKTNKTLISHGAIFNRTIIRGNVGSLLITATVLPGVASRETQLEFGKQAEAYYRDIDWGLDISEVEAGELTFRGLPSRIIRRDPDTQVVIRRENALKGTWREIDLSKTYWPTAIQLFLDRGDMDVVLVAPKKSKKFSDLRDGLKRLQDNGIADQN